VAVSLFMGAKMSASSSAPCLKRVALLVTPGKMQTSYSG
jgi:hypothetical protein